MKKFIGVIFVLLYTVDFIDGCITKTVPVPPKSFLIDQKTPVYYLGNGQSFYRTLEWLNTTKPIKHVKFHKSDEDIKPYTLFLKTMVIVDYLMYVNYGDQVIDRVMSYMASTESLANEEYRYPKLKFVVTSIVIPTDFYYLEFMIPDHNQNLKTSSSWFRKMHRVISYIRYSKFEADNHFVVVISSAKSLYVDHELFLNIISNGTLNCQSKDSLSVIVATDKLPDKNYFPVCSEFMQIVSVGQENYVCAENFVRRNQKLSRSAQYPACTFANLQQEFNNSWPSCLYDPPYFLK